MRHQRECSILSDAAKARTKIRRAIWCAEARVAASRRMHDQERGKGRIVALKWAKRLLTEMVIRDE